MCAPFNRPLSCGFNCFTELCRTLQSTCLRWPMNRCLVCRVTAALTTKWGVREGSEGTKGRIWECVASPVTNVTNSVLPHQGVLPTLCCLTSVLPKVCCLTSVLPRGVCCLSRLSMSSHQQVLWWLPNRIDHTVRFCKFSGWYGLVRIRGRRIFKIAK